MIMGTLYDTGYNLTNLVEELLKIERKISAKPSFFGHVNMNCTILLTNKIWYTLYSFLINLKLFHLISTNKNISDLVK